MKATIAMFVFGYPNSNQTQAYTQCNEVCSGDKLSMQTALIDRMEEDNANLQYKHCASGAFQKDHGACMGCLNSVPSASTLLNSESYQKQGIPSTLIWAFLTWVFPQTSAPSTLPAPNSPHPVPTPPST